MTTPTREQRQGAVATAGRALPWITAQSLAAVVALVRLPMVARPLGPDEGGYLMVASQWHAGTSTYGSYFLDRPPVLVGLFDLADRLGGTVALRLMGIVAAVSIVLLAGRLGGRAAAVVAAALVSTPLFGAFSVDGELLAVPFVLAGLAILIPALDSPRSTSVLARTAAAGALAAVAALVKQNMVDVLVVAAVLLLVRGWGGRWRDVGPRASAFLAGVAVTVALVLGWAWSRGTTPSALWDALYTFRAEAAAVIHASANDATPLRFRALLLALVLSGAAVVVGLAVAGFRRREVGVDLRAAAVALLAWEAVGAVAGGSYWLHYLVALIPGVVLVLAAVDLSRTSRGHRRAMTGAVAYTAVSAVVACTAAGLYASPLSSDMQVVSYLKDHSVPGDTAVTGFGHPNILREAGLPSPYPYLWSLPVRVRDSQLSTLDAVLQGPQAPRWLVVSGTSLDSWGISADVAQKEVNDDYRLVLVAGEWHVLERNQ